MYAKVTDALCAARICVYLMHSAFVGMYSALALLYVDVRRSNRSQASGRGGARI
jgi:hypothetical protein